MTNEEAIKRVEIELICMECPLDKPCYNSALESLCEYNDIRENVSLCESLKVILSALKDRPTGGDLISRQSVINAIANTCFWLSADNWEELTKCINSIPSADILDHARAIKEYCESRPNEHCDNCVFGIKNEFYKCGLDDIPHLWDLPEGEKGGAE